MVKEEKSSVIGKHKKKLIATGTGGISIAALTLFMNVYTKADERLKIVEKATNSCEINLSVMKEDVKEIKKDIKYLIRKKIDE